MYINYYLSQDINKIKILILCTNQCEQLLDINIFLFVTRKRVLHFSVTLYLIKETKWLCGLINY